MVNYKKENNEVMHVKMLGEFSVRMGGRELSLRTNTVTKAMHLLIILLWHRDGITKEKLIEYLYGNENVTNPSNSLRVTSFRMKKILVEVGFSEAEYVKNEGGIYSWAGEIPVQVDAVEFEELIKEAAGKKAEKEKAELLMKACRMYQGEFLPKLSGEYWVIMESVCYKEMYRQALTELFDYLREQEEYGQMLEYASAACNYYPFDEWQSMKIEALMALDRNQEALAVYKDTAKMLFEELGITPSEKILQQFRVLGERMHNAPQAIEDIKGQLREKALEGAYYVSLPSFVDSYRLTRRLIERSGQSVCLILCTLTDGQGNALEPGKKLQEMTAEIKGSIQCSLRKGDSFTQYSHNQFLIMIPEITVEKCSVITGRIKKKFCEHHRYWNNCIEFFVSSIVDFNI